MMNNKYKLINMICNSEGHFEDATLETSFLKDKVNDFFDILSVHISNRNINREQESLILNIEKKITKEFKIFDIYTVSGMKDFMKFLMKGIEKKELLFFNEKKICEIINQVYTLNRKINIINKDFYEKMCCTRLISTKDELSELYKKYKEFTNADLCKKHIGIFIVDNKEIDDPFMLLRKKCTCWDEKIGGTIFAAPFEKGNCQIPYIRTLFRFYHYYFELYLSSKYYESLEENDFGNKVYKYIYGKFRKNDFFEPHAMLESIAWEYSMKMVSKNFLDNMDILNFNFYKENGYYVSDCIVDTVSNLTHQRMDKRSRIASMILKKRMFESVIDKKKIIEILITCMDEGSMQRGYESYLYNK